MKKIREAWRNQGFTVSQEHRGKLVNYKNITHDKNKFRVIQANPSFLEENDFISLEKYKRARANHYKGGLLF